MAPTPRPRASLDFPDAIDPTLHSPTPRPRGDAARLIEAMEAGNRVLLQEARKQTTLLRFIAGWVLAAGFASAGLLLAGTAAVVFAAVRTGNTVLIAATAAAVLLALVLTVAFVTALRRVVFHLFKIRA